MWYPQFLINGVILWLLTSVKNPEKAKQLRERMLEIFLSIRAAYAGDPDFK